VAQPSEIQVKRLLLRECEVSIAIRGICTAMVGIARGFCRTP
jgi:hypothetical protein